MAAFVEFKPIAYNDIPLEYRKQIKEYVKENIHHLVRNEYKKFLPEIYEGILNILETWRYHLTLQLSQSKNKHISTQGNFVGDQATSFTEFNERAVTKRHQGGFNEKTCAVLDNKIRGILIKVFDIIVGVKSEIKLASCLEYRNYLCDLLPDGDNCAFISIMSTDNPIYLRLNEVPKVTVSDSEDDTGCIFPEDEEEISSPK